MYQTRRNILAGIGAVATVGFSATQVFGQSNTNIEVQEVNYEGEYVFMNNGSEDVDVSGYTVAFEYGNDDTNQRRELGDGVTIPAGGTLTVAMGAEDVSNADETFGYKGSVLRNDGSDVVALLTPDGKWSQRARMLPRRPPRKQRLRRRQRTTPKRRLKTVSAIGYQFFVKRLARRFRRS